MIKKETVLVLGAGASMDYGFPSGEYLLQDIVNTLKGNLIDNEVENIKLFIAFVACCYVRDKRISSKINNSDQDNYYKIMRGLVDAFEERLIRSNAVSIDDFLDKLGEDNIELKIIGKILIVISISDYEKEEALFYKHEKVVEGHRYFPRRFSPYGGGCISLTRGWYNNLWAKLYEGDNLAGYLKRLTIISFNYDRSLEQYLFNSIRSMSTMSKEETADCMNKHLFIHHVYGQLGKLPWQNDTQGAVNSYQPLPIKNVLSAMKGSVGSPIRNLQSFTVMSEFMDIKDRKGNKQINIDINAVCDIVEMIRTYTEAFENPSYESVKARISKAERLFFLGFGYHPENIKWLGEKALQNNKNMIYAGTTYMKGKVIIGEITKQLKQLFSESSTHNSQKIHKYYNVEYSEYKIKDYLENVVNIE
jgi:hypothetical protein